MQEKHSQQLSRIQEFVKLIIEAQCSAGIQEKHF